MVRCNDDALASRPRIDCVDFAAAPAAPQGRIQPQCRPDIDSYPIASRSASSPVYPVKLPAMVPCGGIRPPSPAAMPSYSSPRTRSQRPMLAWNLYGSGLPEGSSTSSMATRKWSMHSRPPRYQGGELRRSTPIANMSTSAHQAGKRVQALARQEHMVVLPDADLDQRRDALMAPATARRRTLPWHFPWPFRSQGNRRCAGGKLKPRVESLKIGPATDKDAEMGPSSPECTAQDRRLHR